MSAFFVAAGAWLSKSPGCWIALAASVVLAVWLSGSLGYRRGYAVCDAVRNVAAIAETARQNVVGAAVVQRAETAAVADIAKDKTNREVILHVVKTIQAQPDAGAECIPAAVADRLRDLD